MNATLLGTVTDVSGAVVPNAKVTITEINTNVIHSGQTNESGNYLFPNLPPGMYSVAVEAKGFKKETRKDISAAGGHQHARRRPVAAGQHHRDRGSDRRAADAPDRHRRDRRRKSKRRRARERAADQFQPQFPEPA